MKQVVKPGNSFKRMLGKDARVEAAKKDDPPKPNLLGNYSKLAIFPRDSTQLINKADVSILKSNVVKFTPEDLVATVRISSEKVVFLEKGNAASGLQHILAHAKEFASIGVHESEIPSFLLKAIRDGKIIGYQEKGLGRPIYQVNHNGREVKVAITIGDNGYIVGANPRGFVK